MSRAKIIDHYLQESEKPGFDIRIIRRELEEKGVQEEEIRTIVKLVDNDMQGRLVAGARTRQRNNLFRVGVAVAAVGIVINLGSWMGWIDTGGNLVILLGPLAGGMGLMAIVRRYK